VFAWTYSSIVLRRLPAVAFLVRTASRDRGGRLPASNWLKQNCTPSATIESQNWRTVAACMATSSSRSSITSDEPGAPLAASAAASGPAALGAAWQSVPRNERMAAHKIECNACPVLCQISDGKAGACDRYANQGGLLVRLDREGGTILDLAADLAAEVVVVTSPRLGTLNHTELTVNALRARGIEPAGLVIGAWPAQPDLAEECNADDLPRLTGVPVIATVPAGAGLLDREEFRARAAGWFG